MDYCTFRMPKYLSLFKTNKVRNWSCFQKFSRQLQASRRHQDQKSAAIINAYPDDRSPEDQLRPIIASGRRWMVSMDNVLDLYFPRWPWEPPGGEGGRGRRGEGGRGEAPHIICRGRKKRHTTPPASAAERLVVAAAAAYNAQFREYFHRFQSC